MGRFKSLELEQGQNSPAESGFSASEENCSFGEGVKGADDFLREAVEAVGLCEFEKALRLFARVLSFDNKNKTAWFGQIRCLLYLDEYKEALMWADKAIEAVGEGSELLAAKSCAYCRMGDFSRAYGLSDVSMEMKGTGPFVWLCRGEILLQQKKKNYTFCFDQALTVPSESAWQILIEIARVLMFYGKAAGALPYLETAKEKAPSQALVWYELGNCYADMGMKNNALEAYGHAEELNPEMAVVKDAVKGVRNTGVISNLKRRMFG